MKCFVICLGLATLAFGLVQCAMSVHPLYLPGDVVYDPILEGTWYDPEHPDKTVYTLDKDGSEAYKVTLDQDAGDAGLTIDSERARTGRVKDAFVGRLVRLGQYRFFDITPGEMPVGSDIYRMHFLPLHSFYWVEIVGPDDVTIRALDPKWLRNKIGEIPQDSDDSIIMSSPTADLQSLMFRAVETPWAFGEPLELRRRK